VPSTWAFLAAPPAEGKSLRPAHADPLEALQYAPGAWVALCEPGAGGWNRPVAWGDATAALREFACRCAEDALLREGREGREPDARSWAAVRAARRRLRGEIDDEALSAAWSAAWSAAESAAWSAAGSAARWAAGSAAGSAAW
jgi:hypothetical protein